MYWKISHEPINIVTSDDIFTEHVCFRHVTKSHYQVFQCPLAVEGIYRIESRISSHLCLL